MNETNADKVLDAIELSFRIIDTHTRKFDYLNRQNADQIATEAIQELDVRFKEHSVGYQLWTGKSCGWILPSSTLRLLFPL